MNVRVHVGDKREHLTVLEKIRTGSKITHFLCQCDCGKTKRISVHSLGRIKSCGCRLFVRYKEHRDFKGCGKLPLAKWNTFKRNAKKRGIPFDLSIEEGWNLFEEQEEKCAFTGIEIAFWVGSGRTRRRSTASLDRIDSTKGYTIHNVHWVHKRINQIKMDMPLDEFISWCRKVTEYADKD